MGKLLKQLSEDPELVDKYVAAFNAEPKLKQARIEIGKLWLITFSSFLLTMYAPGWLELCVGSLGRTLWETGCHGKGCGPEPRGGTWDPVSVFVFVFLWLRCIS